MDNHFFLQFLIIFIMSKFLLIIIVNFVINFNILIFFSLFIGKCKIQSMHSCWWATIFTVIIGIVSTLLHVPKNTLYLVVNYQLESSKLFTAIIMNLPTRFIKFLIEYYKKIIQNLTLSLCFKSFII